MSAEVFVLGDEIFFFTFIRRKQVLYEYRRWSDVQAISELLKI